jgi:DNA-binding PadR family transcriptional regulator
MAKRRTQIAGAFVARPRQLIDSPVMAAMSQAAFRALNRIESEHLAQGGAENGRLIITFSDFEWAGLHPNMIAPALRELEALGLIETTRKGYGGAAAMRAPSTYRLTYVAAWNARRSDGTGTHDYLKFGSEADAETAAKAARKATNRSVVRRAKEFSATLSLCKISPSESEGETAKSRPHKVRVLSHPHKVRLPSISWDVEATPESASRSVMPTSAGAVQPDCSTHAELAIKFPLIDGVYRVAGRAEPAVVCASPAPTLPIDEIQATAAPAEAA